MTDVRYVHVINTTQFQSLHITGTASEIDALTDADILEQVQFQASATGLIRQAWQKAIKGEPLTQPEVEELIKTELDAKVVEVTEHEVKPAWAVEVTPQAKPWEKTNEDDGDDW